MIIEKDFGPGNEDIEYIEYGGIRFTNTAYQKFDYPIRIMLKQIYNFFKALR
jgi:hypothetical protein